MRVFTLVIDDINTIFIELLFEIGDHFKILWWLLIILYFRIVLFLHIIHINQNIITFILFLIIYWYYRLLISLLGMRTYLWQVHEIGWHSCIKINVLITLLFLNLVVYYVYRRFLIRIFETLISFELNIINILRLL